MNSRRSLAGYLALVVLGALIAQGAWPAQAPSPPPNLLLVTVDTLRPDALGWVSGLSSTPEFDRLAAEGFGFPGAISPVPITLPAHLSVMSGLLPRRHGVRDNGQVVGAAPPLLAELLQRHGYRTAAFVSGFPLKASFGLKRGFQLYDDRTTAGDGAWLERPAAETTAAAVEWLGSLSRKPASPWFLWVHYYDPHFPYAGSDASRAAYDAEVAAVDRAFGELRRHLPASKPLLTVFAADHGESLGEHGEGTHGFFIYDSTVRVPLVVHFPGRLAPDKSLAPAGLVDIAPTVLDLLGLPALADSDGRSLVPLLTAQPTRESFADSDSLSPAYIETRQPFNSYGWAPLRGIVHQGWKLIAAPRSELYDLTQDPSESRNLVDQERRKARELIALLQEVEARPVVSSATSIDPASSDQETLEALRALGYVGAGHQASEPGPGLADPKDRIALRELLTSADDLLLHGEFGGALTRFDQVLAEEPANRFALSRSGEALLRLGDLPQAIGRLERATALDPKRAELRALLAEALTRAGSLDAAIGQWLELVHLQPGEARAWSNLGAALGKAGRVADAIGALARAADLDPTSPDRLVRLAFAEVSAGRKADAVKHLQLAEGRTGSDGFTHAGALGLLLLELGRPQEARPYLDRCRPAEPEYTAAKSALAKLQRP